MVSSNYYTHYTLLNPIPVGCNPLWFPTTLDGDRILSPLFFSQPHTFLALPPCSLDYVLPVPRIHLEWLTVPCFTHPPSFDYPYVYYTCSYQILMLTYPSPILHVLLLLYIFNHFTHQMAPHTLSTSAPPISHSPISPNIQFPITWLPCSFYFALLKLKMFSKWAS